MPRGIPRHKTEGVVSTSNGSIADQLERIDTERRILKIQALQNELESIRNRARMAKTTEERQQVNVSIDNMTNALLAALSH